MIKKLLIKFYTFKLKRIDKNIRELKLFIYSNTVNETERRLYKRYLKSCEIESRDLRTKLDRLL